MPRVTAVQKLAQAHYSGYQEGRRDEQEIRLKQAKEFEEQMKAAKGRQVEAVTELIKATTKNLSACGYLISKLNNQSGW